MSTTKTYYLDEDQLGSEWTENDDIHGFAAALEEVTGVRVIVGLGVSDTEIAEDEFNRALDLYVEFADLEGA